MATERGRVYWLAQNEMQHTTPDWKIHFSIAPRGEWEEDIGQAWNILGALFLERCCEVGMKARYSCWEDPVQQGREMTVYVYVFSEEYDKGHQGGPMEGLSNLGDEHLHHLGYEYEAAFGAKFWFLFIQEAESRLNEAGLHTAGVADGDLALPGCRFASIRNEAFVPVPNPDWREGQHEHMKVCLEYPPNAEGWNAAGHQNPLHETVVMLQASVLQTLQLTEHQNRACSYARASC